MEDILIYVGLGFFASLIDGCIGMAYGTFLTSIFTMMGIPLLTTSVCIHFSEIFTTCASGLSHITFKNVDFKLFKKIVIPGVLGALIGATFLLIVDNYFLKPFVGVYLICLGAYIISRTRKKPKSKKKKVKSFSRFRFLGFIGGFFDASSGGGWGPIVTGTLVSRGHLPHKTIGTVNLTEFFVTVSQSILFLTVLGLTSFKVILGLIIGSVIAAPIAAYSVKKFNILILMRLVGCIIILSNIATLVLYFKDLL